MTEMKVLHDKLIPTSFNEFLKLVHKDQRLGGPYPYLIPGPDRKKGFGGKCLPKDLRALTAEAEELGINMTILRRIWSVNLRVRKDRNWEKIEGAMIK